MLHPCQPARRAVAESGLRARMMSWAEEVPGHDDQVGDAGAVPVIAHGEQAGIVARRQPRGHGPIGAVRDRRPQRALLGLELELLGAGVADEIPDRRVVRQRPQPLRAAGRTEHVRRDPALAQRADVLGRAFEDGLLLGEAKRPPTGSALRHGATKAARKFYTMYNAGQNAGLI